MHIFVGLVQKHPGLIVGVVLSILLLSIYSAQHVVFEYKIDTYFDKDNKVYRQYKQYTSDFGISAEGVFIFIKGDDVTSKEVLEYMLLLSKELKQVDYVGEVVSPASIITSIYGRIPADETLIDRAIETYAKDLVPKPTLAIISIQITTSDSTKYGDIANQIEKVIEFTPKPAGVTVEMTGGPILSYQIMESVRDSMKITTSASVILMVVILFAVFSGVVRRKILALLPLLVSILSVAFVYGLMPVLGIPMTEVTNGFMPILIGLAIEYAAQLQNRFEEERREGRDVDSAVSTAITSTGLAIALAMLTTVIGFLSMLFSGVPALGWFGILSAIGLAVAFVLTLTFLAAVLKLTDKGAKAEKREIKELGLLERSLGFLAKVTATYPKVILVVTLVVLVIGAYGYMNVKLETNMRNYAPQDLPAIVLFKELERTLGGQYYYTVVLSVDELNADVVKKADELGKYIAEKESYVDSYDTISTLIKQYYGKLPENDVKLEMVLSRIPEHQLKRYISGHWIAIHLATHAKDFEEQKKLYDSIKRDVSFFGWDDGYYISGMTPLRMEFGKLMLYGQSKMTVGAYVLIVILMFLVYRSIAKAVVPLLSITTVIAIVNAIMFFFNIKQTMLSTTMNSIVLGLGIDFSIHVLERYSEERGSFDPMTAVMRTVERTGKAITTSALTMAGGFGALLLSPFPLMQTFGILALIAIIFSLLASLTVVPAFLMIAEKFKGRYET